MWHCILVHGLALCALDVSHAPCVLGRCVRSVFVLHSEAELSRHGHMGESWAAPMACGHPLVLVGKGGGGWVAGCVARRALQWPQYPNHEQAPVQHWGPGRTYGAISQPHGDRALDPRDRLPWSWGASRCQPIKFGHWQTQRQHKGPAGACRQSARCPGMGQAAAWRVGKASEPL